MYLYNKLERLEPRGAGTQVDVQNIKEVRHLLIEITDDNQSNKNESLKIRVYICL